MLWQRNLAWNTEAQVSPLAVCLPMKALNSDAPKGYALLGAFLCFAESYL